MAIDDVMVVGDYGALQRKTLKSGKQRYRVTITSEPLCVQTDAKSLGLTVANAIAEHIRNRIQMISERAAPATLKARAAARKAFAAGDQWARDRYSGGRLGSLPPGQSDRLFNDSGRFARSVAVGASGNAWLINIAANRLDAASLDGKEGGMAALARIVTRLVSLVPELGDAGQMSTSLPVRAAIRDVMAGMLRKATDKTVELNKQLVRAKFELVKELLAI